MLMGSTLPIAAQDDYNPDFPADPGDVSQILSYTVSVDINDTKMGYVSGAGKFKYGRSVTISTSAQSGYQFKHWLKDGVEYSTSTSFTYTVEADVTFTAVYEEKPSSGGDSGGGSGSGDSGSTEPKVPDYDPSYSPDFPGDPSTPTFPDDPSGDDDDPVTPAVTHKLNLVPSPAGCCTFSMESGSAVAENTTYSVTAVPGTDMSFQGWYLNGTKVGSELTYSATMGTSNVTLTAKFEYIPEFPDDPVNDLPNVIKGDINGDGKVNVTDVVMLTNRIVKGTAGTLDPNVADMTGDGKVNVSDIVALTTYCVKNK